MKSKWSNMLLVLVMILGTLITAAPTRVTTTANASGDGFHIVSLQPDVEQALRAQGKQIKYPFPNTANKGKKFNPVGDTVTALNTAATQNVLVIFANFTTTPPGASANRLDLATYFDPMLFGTVYDPPEYAAYPNHPTNRTLVNYYAEASYGKVHVTTLNMPSVMGWTQTGHPYEYYSRADGVHDNGFGPFPENAQGMVLDAVKAVDNQVDFKNYAVNGEVPNLFVVFAGTGAEWSGTSDLIWSHSWDLSDGTGMDGYTTNDGVKINNYAVMPEVGGDLTGFTGTKSGPYPPTVGVYAHEYGHVLGLPDEYDYGYESDGVDVYSLMAGGSWNRYPTDRIFSGNSPAHFDAWSKYRLGFLTPVEITSTKSLPVTLPPAETNPVVYKMVVPNSGGREYFLFENRQPIGFDQGLERFRTHGLAIYHIDDTVLTRNYWRPNEAQNWKEFRSEGAQKAWTGEIHYGISIIQADDRWDLEHAAYSLTSTFSTLAGDLYPGSTGKTEFSSYTTPNSSNYYFWGGSDPKFGYSGVTVKNIMETGQIITADFSFVPWVPKTK